MNFEMTHDVASDLWSLKMSGNASAESLSLLDKYLSQDEAFAATLKESESLTLGMPNVRLSPDAERRLLDEARRHSKTKLLVVGMAIGFAGIIGLLALGGLLFMMLRSV